MEDHLVGILGFADDAEDEVIEFGRGLEQQLALQCTGGDFDEGVFRNEAERSWHTGLSATNGEKLPRPNSGQRCPGRENACAVSGAASPRGFKTLAPSTGLELPTLEAAAPGEEET
jgi:hypothetical protein